MPPISPVRLSLEGVTLQRGGRVLARDLALTLEPGEAVVLRGPNGAGKTTLLRTLAGFTPLEAGTIRLRCIDTGAPRAACETVAYLAHADGLRPHETPRGHIDFHARWFSGSPAADGALEAFGVTAFADRPARRLSAGQRRRAALARVLASGRTLWLLDEPAAPLDPEGRARLAAAVDAHRGAGGSVVAAAHDALAWDDAREMTLGRDR